MSTFTIFCWSYIPIVMVLQTIVTILVEETKRHFSAYCEYWSICILMSKLETTSYTSETRRSGDQPPLTVSHEQSWILRCGLPRVCPAAQLPGISGTLLTAGSSIQRPSPGWFTAGHWLLAAADRQLWNYCHAMEEITLLISFNHIINYLNLLENMFSLNNS